MQYLLCNDCRYEFIFLPSRGFGMRLSRALKVGLVLALVVLTGWRD
jgi:hypothetical protein